jgi:hypothetical protein
VVDHIARAAAPALAGSRAGLLALEFGAGGVGAGLGDAYADNSNQYGSHERSLHTSVFFHFSLVSAAHLLLHSTPPPQTARQL